MVPIPGNIVVPIKPPKDLPPSPQTTLANDDPAFFFNLVINSS